MFIPKIFNIAVNLNAFVCRWTAQKGAAYYGVTSVIFFEMAGLHRNKQLPYIRLGHVSPHHSAGIKIVCILPYGIHPLHPVKFNMHLTSY